jgi:hypothetical protein
MIPFAQHSNLAVRFLLELALLAAVGGATWQSVAQPALRLLAAVAAVSAVALAWGALVHGTVPGPVSAGAQLGALALGTYALVRLGAPRVAAAFTVTALVNAALLAVWNQ